MQRNKTIKERGDITIDTTQTQTIIKTKNNYTPRKLTNFQLDPSKKKRIQINKIRNENEMEAAFLR